MNSDSTNRLASEQTMQKLDRIARELALICAELRARGVETEAFAAPEIAASPDPDVILFTEPRYAVGAYRYSDLEHAIAEAKRARRDAALGATSQAKR